MTIFQKVTLQSLRKNTTRTFVTIIGIILSVSMICAVTTFASSFMNYARKTAIYTDGNWHGYEWSTTYETCQAVESSEKTEETVYLQQLGFARVEECENEFKPYLYLLGAGAGVEEVLPIHITAGQYPTSPDEILLPDHLYTNGGVQYKLGDEITLDLGERMLDGYRLTQKEPCYIYEKGEEVHNGEVLKVRETRTYRVVGFYERISWRIEWMTSPGYTAITVADPKAGEEYRYDVYFRMEKPREVYDYMMDMGFSGGTNTDLLMYSGTFQFNTFSELLYGLATIVILLIMFGSVALIYNAFSISVSERTRQFGLLSSVGATKRQLRRMVLWEALLVSLVGVPLGILAGVGGIGVTLMLIGDKFRASGFPIDMELCVSPWAIGVAVVVATVTVLISAWIPSKRATRVSAVEAIRQNPDINLRGRSNKTSKLTYKLFGLPGVLASKHYKRSRKKYRTTILSLFMSIVLFVSASAFTDYLMETVTGGFASVGYDMRLFASADEFESVTPMALLAKMRAAKSVTRAAYSQERVVYGTIKNEYLTDEGINYLERNQGRGNDQPVRNLYTYITFVEDAAFCDFLRENGLSEEAYMNPENPLAIGVDGILRFNQDTQKYETVIFFRGDTAELTVQKEREIPGYYCTGEILGEDGNLMVGYAKSPDSELEGEETLSFLPAEAYVNTTIRVGSIVYEKPFFLSDNDGMRLIYPISLAEAVFDDFQESYNGYQYMITSENHAESYSAVQAILNDSGLNSKNLQNIAEMEESQRNTVIIIRVFSYGFIVLISLIAAANVFNTISTNVSLRRREFAMLKSVGMTQRDFRKMMNFECLLYGCRALLYGIPVSCGITYLIYRSIMKGYEIGFHLPWTAIGIAALSVFLVVFVTMIYSMGKVRKDNPIDNLKNENI